MALRLQFITVIVKRADLARCRNLPLFMSTLNSSDGILLETSWYHRYCAVRKIGDRSPGTAQSGGESEEGRRPAPLGRVPATQAWVRGEGRGLAACPASPRAFPANEAARANV